MSGEQLKDHGYGEIIHPDGTRERLLDSQPVQEIDPSLPSMGDPYERVLNKRRDDFYRINGYMDWQKIEKPDEVISLSELGLDFNILAYPSVHDGEAVIQIVRDGESKSFAGLREELEVRYPYLKDNDFWFALNRKIDELKQSVWPSFDGAKKYAEKVAGSLRMRVEDLKKAAEKVSDMQAQNEFPSTSHSNEVPSGLPLMSSSEWDELEGRPPVKPHKTGILERLFKRRS